MKQDNSRVQKRTKQPRLDVVKFDIASRREFITGFSKRKSLRKLKGQRRAAKESRDKQLSERKSVRNHMSAEFRRSEANEGVEFRGAAADAPQVTCEVSVLNDVHVVTTTW